MAEDLLLSLLESLHWECLLTVRCLNILDHLKKCPITLEVPLCRVMARFFCVHFIEGVSLKVFRIPLRMRTHLSRSLTGLHIKWPRMVAYQIPGY